MIGATTPTVPLPSSNTCWVFDTHSHWLSERVYPLGGLAQAYCHSAGSGSLLPKAPQVSLALIQVTAVEERDDSMQKPSGPPSTGTNFSVELLQVSGCGVKRWSFAARPA